MYGDIRIIFVSYVFSILLCTMVMAYFWRQNRNRNPETALWFIYYALQLIAIFLFALHGILPDLFTIVIAHSLLITGSVFLYIGVCRYVGIETRQLHNYVMIAVFALVHFYLTYIYPNLELRVINLSVALLYISAQGSWLMLHRVNAEMRPATRLTGIVCAVLCILGVVQIPLSLIIPKTKHIWETGYWVVAFITIYQILFIALSFSLFLMVSRRLSVSLEDELIQRRQEQELMRLRLSLLEFATNHSLDEVLQHTLDEVGALVDSPIGFYHFVESNQKTLSLQAWSTRTLKEFCKAEGKGLHYAIDQAGVWVDCVHERRAVIHNDYNSLPHRKGMPEGHAPVVRELVVPIMRGGLVVAILGIGNKLEDYTQKDAELVSYLADVAWEITRRKQAEEALKRSEEQVRLLLNSTAEAIYGIDLDGNCTFANLSCLNMLGYSNMEQLLGNNMHRLIHHSYPDGTKMDVEDCRIFRAFRKGKGEHADDEVLWKADGTSFAAEYWSYPQIVNGKISGAVVAFTDITERKLTEKYREMSNEILHILSKPMALHDAIQNVLSVLKTRMGFDAIGIRLRDKDDFPYFAENGFSDEFLLTEDKLTEIDEKGGLCRDKDGNVSLQCTCGLVISGRTDPANPLFTKGGSFWTNDSFPLLELSPDQDPRIHPRNKCIRQGYASFALVPIRNRDSIIGLIQFNDRRKNCFSLAAIEQFEGIAVNIGEAILRIEAEDALRKSEEKFKQLAEVFPETIFEADMKGYVTYANEHGLKHFGFTKEDITKGVNILDLISPDDRLLALERIQSRIEGGNKKYLEYRALKKDGSTFYALALSIPIMVDGQSIGIRGFILDITESKRAENALKQNEVFLNTLLNSIPIPVFYKDRDGRYTGFNRAFETFFGATKKQLIGKSVFDINPPELAKIYHAKDNELFESGREQHYETQVKNMLGVTRDVIFNKAVFTDSQGKISGLIGAILDISERKQAENALRESEERIRTITNSANDAIVMIDNDGNISYWNPAAEKVLGYTNAEALGRNVHELIAPERFLPAHNAAFPEFQKSGKGNAVGKRLELAARRKDGREIDVAVSLSAVNIKGTWNAVGIIQDISELKRAEQMIRESEERYRFLTDHTADHIWTMDMSMHFTYSSPAITKILGYTIQELMAKPFDQFYTPESFLTAQKALMEELETDMDPNADPNRIRTLQSEHYHKNGNLVWLESSLTFIRDAEMKPVGILGVSRDITERKKSEEQIKHLATHDLLTDLPGLRLARDRMSSAINMARRYKKSVALMFVDLDGFKNVNDTLGHDAGDYVLRQVALRLLSCVRDTDTVARLGGDEFLIIATEINAPENAEQIARKVIKLVSQPVIFKEQQAVVGTSIGIALFPDDGSDMDQLLKLADEAMYKVKNAGKNGFRFVNTPIK